MEGEEWKLEGGELVRRIRSDEGLMLETSASESLYGGQFPLSTQLIKPNYNVRSANSKFAYDISSLAL